MSLIGVIHCGGTELVIETGLVRRAFRSLVRVCDVTVGLSVCRVGLAGTSNAL